MEKVISAISTASGTGGVAIIRMSGEGVLDIAEKMFKPLQKNQKVKDFEPYKMYVGEILCNGFTDFGMAVFFKGPKSYTGEDMVEFHSHGGIAISRGVLKKTFELGALPATRGEFTKRAFVNGKLSLDSCEGLINMINSESTAGVKVGYNLYREKLYKIINELQDGLTNALASIDADIDYPEEDLEELALTGVTSVLTETKKQVQELLAKYQVGEKAKNGVKVAIVGKPNTGKSSILNSLLNYEKAIVSSIAGTTRDIVEGNIEINGIVFNLFDTAGIRETTDGIEKLGIERSSKILKSADVVLAVLDGSNQLDKDDKEILSKIEDKKFVKVYNKNDVNQNFAQNNGISVSAKTGEGIDLLKQALYDQVFESGIDLNSEYVVEERHYYALKNAENSINEALSSIGNAPLDLVAEDVKQVWSYLGEITGKTASEEIIDEIFKKFCVGK